MENNQYISSIINQLVPKLKDYLTEQGVRINGKGFFTCIHPKHPDRHPSCSIGGNLNETVFHCFSCLPPFEKIRTPKGLVQICDLNLGDAVYSQYGTGTITHIIKQKPEEDTIEVQLQLVRNDNIKFTGNHIFKVVKNITQKVPYIKEQKDGNYDLRFFKKLKRKTKTKKYKNALVINECRADELKENDYLIFPKTTKNTSSIITEIENKWIKEYTSGPKNNRITAYPVNNDTMWLLGLYCAEGSSYRGGITFTLHRNEKEFQEKIKRIIKENFKLDCSKYEYDYKANTTNISCNSTDLQMFFDGFVGKYSSFKYISNDVLFGMNDSLQLSWLNGLFDGDAGKRKPKRLTLVNEELISTAQQVMVNLEIPFSYSYNNGYYGNDGIERKPTWSLTWLSKENIGCFYDTASDGHRYAFLRIDKVYKSQPLKEVYDITVHEIKTNSHTFMTKHYLVHNCGVAGNIFHAAHFLENKPLTGIGFYDDTLKYLAEKFNIEYTPIEISDDVKREYQKRRAYQDAVNVIHYGCFDGIDLRKDHPAIAHLLERNINEQTIKKFKIGCIDSYTDYLNEMKGMGWTDREWLNGADLANKGLFHKDGIIIPIFDDKNRPVGFVTRKTNMVANAKGNEKYCNSLNSDIYHKSEILYNFNNFCKEDGPLYIVEGYLDAVYLTQMGLPNVAAIGATVLTEQHIKLLMDYSAKDIILCLDADTGGKKGTEVAIERLAPYKYFNIRVMELPEGYDPDTFVREKGLEEFKELAKPDVALLPFTWMLKHTTFEDDPMVVAEKAVPAIATEESNIVRLKMIRQLSQLTGVPEQDIKKDVDSLVNKDSSVFLDELNNLNNFVQVQLSKRKIKDTKSILQDAMVRITSLEKIHNNTVDNKSEYGKRITSMKEKIEGGDYKYGLLTPRFPDLQEAWDGTPYTSCLTLVGGRPSAGKCLDPNELVWMYNGSLKKAKDVKYGDLLMGDDSTPRRVLGTTSGEDYMYDIIQANGITYRVNEPHVLSLKRSRNGVTVKHGDIIDIPLNKYVKKSNKFKNNFKGYKVPIEFKSQDLLIDPYFLGIWLGDGDSNSSKIYTIDNEVVGYIYEYANTLSLKVTENKNGTCPSYAITKGKCFTNRNFSFQQLLRVETLLGNKHIPEKYIINSRENRLELLAGLIDSDGYYCADKGYFEITQIKEDLARSIKKLADTLGFRTNLSKKKTQCKESKYQGEAFRLLISGNIWDIPTKIKRKMAPKTEKRDWTMSQIKVQSAGKGEYAGFELDGNGRFLLSDGTVTHNTTWLSAVAIELVEANDDAAVFYMSIDDTTELMTLKMLAMRSGLSTSKIKRYIELNKEDKQKVDEAFAWLDRISERFIISDASGGNTIEALEAHIDWFVKTFPDKKRVLLLDNFHKLSTHGLKTSKTEAVSALSERIKTQSQLNDLHLIATVELRKLEGSNSMPQVSDLKDSVQMEYDADVIMLVHNDKQVNENTNIFWTCNEPIEGETGRLMPILETHICKNKMTGVIKKMAYTLNSYNLQIEEIRYAEVKQKRAQKASKNNRPMSFSQKGNII